MNPSANEFLKSFSQRKTNFYKDKSTPNPITGKPSYTFNQFWKTTSKGKLLRCVGTDHATKQNIQQLKIHVENTLKEAPVDIVLTEGGTGPFNYFDETLLETKYNHQQIKPDSTSTTTEETFTCEMSYMRQLAEKNNKKVFCIEPKFEDEKKRFKNLLTHKLDALLKDKTILKKTKRTLNKLKMKPFQLATAFYIIRSFNNVLSSLNNKTANVLKKRKFNYEDLQRELCQNSKLFSEQEIIQSMSLIKELIPSINTYISNNDTNWLAAPADKVAAKTIFNYLNNILNNEIREKYWEEVINRIKDYNSLIFVGNGHIKSLEKKL